MKERIYTNAQITSDTDVSNIVHITTKHIDEEAMIILTQDEFLGSLKHWLRTLPMEQRQMVIDELVATTLRTLE